MDDEPVSNGSRTHKPDAQSSAPIVLFDTLDEMDLPIIGRMITEFIPPGGQLFCAGSSGIEYALVALWRETGLLGSGTEISPSGRSATPYFRPQIITVSGSCSPVTDRQISHALAAGFVEVACDSHRLAHGKQRQVGITHALAQGRSALATGKHVIFHTARGPADVRRSHFERAAKSHSGLTKAEKLAAAGASLSHGLAEILHQALRSTGARRAVVCGGDTSTHVARALEVQALEFLSPMAPGGPLCRMHSANEIAHGCEIIFKGGQVGRDSFFVDLAKRAAN
jgi:uncharacterized protein YgbK (DUF1537 family)